MSLAGGSGRTKFATRSLLHVVAVLTLSACGFHLRTWDVGATVESAYVASSPRNPLENPLTRTLRQAGIDLTQTADQAEVVVELLDARHERRSVAVSEQARAAEYETTLGVLYRITDGDGNVLVPEQWLERQRVFRVDRDNILASSEEEALLEREMMNDLVQQMLRALNAAVTDAG